MEVEERTVRMTNFRKQGAQLGWKVPERRIGHREILDMPEEHLKFLVKAV